jgi:hypothetical protein
MWVRKSEWKALQQKQAAVLNLVMLQQELLSAQTLQLNRIEWRLKAMQAEMNSDWADDNRRTSVLPISGDK